MRISTAEAYERAIAAMLQQQVTLSRTQQQVATGQQRLSAADDPANAARSLDLQQALAQIDRFGANASLLRQRLALTEDRLVDINDVLQRVRELALNGNTATVSAADRDILRAEVVQQRAALLSLANSKDGEDHWLFAGSAAGSGPPFAASGGAVTYSGDQLQRRLEIAPGRFLVDNEPGSELFQRVPTGLDGVRVREGAGATGSARLAQMTLADPAQWDGGSYTLTFSAGSYEVRDAGNVLVASGAYAPGSAIAVRGVRLVVEGQPADGDRFVIEPGQNQDLFATLQRLADALAIGGSDAAATARRANALFAGLQDIDQALAHVQERRGDIGLRLNAAEDAEDTHATLNEQFSASLSLIDDLDYAEATGRLSQQLTALQAAQQAFLRIQGLSLFNYL